MSNNLKTLMKETRPQYAAGVPLLLEACALHSDEANGVRIVQLKWRNLENKPIKAVSILVDFWDTFNQHLGTVEHQYINVNAALNAVFGTQEAILLRSNTATRCAIHMKAIVYADDTMWSPSDVATFSPLPDPVNANIPAHLQVQHKRDLAKQGIKATAAEYIPQRYADLWQCGCGKWHKQSYTLCDACRATEEALLAAADVNTIVANLSAFNFEVKKNAYDSALAKMNKASDEPACIAAAQAFEDLGDFSDAQEMAQTCRKKGKEISLDTIYNEAAALSNALIVQQQKRAAELFKKIPGWKDSDECAAQCLAKVKELERQELIERLYQKAEKQKKVRRGILIAILVALVAAAAVFMWKIGIPLINYKRAESKLEQSQFVEAITIFSNLEDFKDSAERVKESHYKHAESLMVEGKWDEASAAFEKAGNYSDANKRITYCVIRSTEEKLDADATADEVMNVVALYSALGTYLDSEERANALTAKADVIVTDQYAEIAALIAEGEYRDADAALKSFGTYGNGQVTAYYYAMGEKCLAEGSLDTALYAFSKAGDYGDAQDRIREIYYKQGDALIAESKWLEAIALFEKADSYSDADKRITYCNLRRTEEERLDAQATEDELRDAANQYKLLGAYLDSEERAAALEERAISILDGKYDKAVELMNSGKYTDAYDAFIALNGYKDSTAKANEILKKISNENSTSEEEMESADAGSNTAQSKPRLGVYGYGVESPIPLIFPSGYLVSEVVENSPAHEGGIQVGDVIVGVDDNEARSADPYDIIAKLQQYSIGDKITVKVYRAEGAVNILEDWDTSRVGDGEYIYIQVTLR